MKQMTGKMKIAIVAVFCCLVAFFAVGGSLAWAQRFDGRIGPKTFAGSVDVSGMDPETARQAVQDRIDGFFASGVLVTVDGSTAPVPLSALAGSDLSSEAVAEGYSVEIVRFDLDRTIAAATSANHDSNGFWDAVRLIEATMRPTKIRAVVSGDEDAIRNAVRGTFPDKEKLGTNAAFSIARSSDGWTVDVVAGTPGDEFDFAPFLPVLLDRLANLDEAPTELAIVHRDPEVTEAVARTETNAAITALSRAPFVLSPPLDGTEVPGNSWSVSATTLVEILKPGANGLDVNREAFDETLDEIAEEVEIPAQNARFERTGGRVVAFAVAAKGTSLDRERTAANFVAVLNAPAVPQNSGSVTTDEKAATSVEIALADVEPLVTNAQGNDLGITDALGTGTSSFKGSPKNRMANIQNGVNLLNGLLIAPDETFSLLAALRPFETDNGYLPELVIKGDKILPEIAGGLCQIGTTTFRAVMHAGLSVVQRQNHSLVVSYYNDPSNGNPGTDATIYDPAPDFQFKNDTGHYVLFEASMDAAAQSLAFTLWGTDDGREGSYTPPVVKRWIPVGDTVETETTSIPVGEKKCQSAHVGADTSFTYTVANADGTSVDRVFESHYRPLPQICLVGVEKLSTPEDLQPVEDSVSSLVTTDAPVTN